VVQRYRRRQDAEHRLRVMRALWTPAAEAGIAIPRIREFDLDTDPAWVIFDALPKSIPSLCAYLKAYFPYHWSVVIADNASTDATLAVAEVLATRDSHVRVLHLDEKGRGRALKAAWLASEADLWELTLRPLPTL
jgi:hypothetical protein